MLILVGVFSFGFTVLTGVVEEKQSRVVEVVLSTVLPRDLLMGKVLGIGILGLVQLGVFVIAGLIAASLTREFRSCRRPRGAAVQLRPLVQPRLHPVLDRARRAGALASRMEEASNASTPVTMVAMGSYFVAIFAVLSDPSGLVAVIATFVPFSAPMVVPMRAAPRGDHADRDRRCCGHHDRDHLGAVHRRWPGLLRRGLQTAGRMRLRDAWRSAGE